MKKVILNLCLLLTLSVFASCEKIDQTKVMDCTQQLFSYIQEKKWSLLHEIYPSSVNFERIYSFKSFDVKEVKPDGGLVKVCLDTENQNTYFTTTNKNVVLYLQESSDKKSYFVEDSRGISKVDDVDIEYLRSKNSADANNLREMTDVQIAKEIVELKDVRSVTKRLFDALRNRDWETFGQLYRDSREIPSFYDVRDSRIVDISVVNDSLVVVHLVTRILSGVDEYKAKNVQLYFVKSSDLREIRLIDTKGLAKRKVLGPSCDEFKRAEVVSDTGLTDLESVRLERRNAAERTGHFARVKEEIRKNLVVKRWTTSCYENVSHYEHAKCINNTSYTLRNISYRFKKDIYDYGYKKLVHELKPGQSVDFDPYDYGIENSLKTSLNVRVDDECIWQIVNASH